MMTAIILFMPVFNFAQDSTHVVAPAIPNEFSWDSIVKVLPAWLEFFLAIMVMFILPMVQFILKRVPTERSVKIQGIIGKILDALTFFQPDKNVNGGVHPKKKV